MEQLTFPSRLTDPDTSRSAPKRIRVSKKQLENAIIATVRNARSPMTAFEIADVVAPKLGVQHDTVRSAVSRAKLPVCETKGRSPAGRPCAMYVWFL